MTLKNPNEFFSGVDSTLDANGFMSICKQCCNEIYDNYYRVEHSIAKAILRTCRKIDLMFDEGSVESTETHLSTLASNNRPSDNIIGIYKSKLVQSQKNNFADPNSEFDLTFHEFGISLPPNSPLEEGSDKDELEKAWGEGWDADDYDYLEEQFSEWKKTHKCDTKAEEMLLREICHKSLEIRKKRKENNGATPAALTKELQDLMKTASVDPSKTSAANSGKSQDTFSSFIKIVEENEPADYYEDKDLFKDFDNIDFYFKKYVTRPLKNFITQSRDFNVDTDDQDDEIVEDEIIENGE
jgi:hypothetical protein